MTATTTMPDSSTATWNAQFAALKTRYPHVRDAILVALHILSQNPIIALEDAKAQANLLGTRITAASVSAAQRLLARQNDKLPAPTAAVRRARRDRTAPPPVDAAALIQQVVSRIQGQASSEADRVREAIRKAIAVLQAAVR